VSRPRKIKKTIVFGGEGRGQNVPVKAEWCMVYLAFEVLGRVGEDFFVCFHHKIFPICGYFWALILQGSLGAELNCIGAEKSMEL